MVCELHFNFLYSTIFSMLYNILKYYFIIIIFSHIYYIYTMQPPPPPLDLLYPPSPNWSHLFLHLKLVLTSARTIASPGQGNTNLFSWQMDSCVNHYSWNMSQWVWPNNTQLYPTSNITIQPLYFKTIFSMISSSSMAKKGLIRFDKL